MTLTTPGIAQVQDKCYVVFGSTEHLLQARTGLKGPEGIISLNPQDNP